MRGKLAKELGAAEIFFFLKALLAGAEPDAEKPAP